MPSVLSARHLARLGGGLLVVRRGNYTATRHDGSTLTGTYRFGETWLGPEFLSFDDTSTSPPDNVILSVEDLLAFYVRKP